MLIYGINSVLEALRGAVRPSQVYLVDGKENPGIAAIRQAARDLRVPVESRRDLSALAGHGGHQGVVAEINVDDLLIDWNAPFADGPLVMLDGIEDPHNFGAALRVCECFGIKEVIYQKDNSCGLTPSSVKVSTGAAFHLRLRLTKLNKAVQQLSAAGIPLVVLENGAAASIYDVRLPEQYCLVIGSEGKGVRFNLRREAKYEVQIPMQGQVNSLNVSCALSAALAQFRRPD